MSELIQPVSNGKVEPKKNTADNTPTSSLGKDAFLQLLVTQMKYQDPLNPNTDTEFVAQLATFSQLEQLQNLGQTSTNTQAFSLVGKDVVVKTTNSSGETIYKQGKVDYVNISGGKVQLSINGNNYSMDDLVQVIDSYFLILQDIPNIREKINLEFDRDEPEDVTFQVNMGKGDYVADNVAIVIKGKVIEEKHIKVDGNKITISKEALAEFEPGIYNATIVFNDPLYTTVADKIAINIKGTPSEPKEPEEPKDPDEPKEPEEPKEP